MRSVEAGASHGRRHMGPDEEIRMKKKIRIAALISGGGTNLQAIIDACGSGAIDAEMVAVGADNPGAKGL